MHFCRIGHGLFTLRSGLFTFRSASVLICSRSVHGRYAFLHGCHAPDACLNAFSHRSFCLRKASQIAPSLADPDPRPTFSSFTLVSLKDVQK
jgi:hypothetical protein